MEYNFNTLSHREKPRPRKLEGSPYAPCDSLPDKYQQECYYSQGSWWGWVYNQDFKKIGDLCLALPLSKKESCFLGVGVVAAQSSYYQVPLTIKKCNAIKSGYHSMICKAGALWTYRGTSQKNIKNAEELCTSVKPSLQSICIKKTQVRP